MVSCCPCGSCTGLWSQTCRIVDVNGKTEDDDMIYELTVVEAMIDWWSITWAEFDFVSPYGKHGIECTGRILRLSLLALVCVQTWARFFSQSVCRAAEGMWLFHAFPEILKVAAWHRSSYWSTGLGMKYLDICYNLLGAQGSEVWEHGAKRCIKSCQAGLDRAIVPGAHETHGNSPQGAPFHMPLFLLVNMCEHVWTLVNTGSQLTHCILKFCPLYCQHCFWTNDAQGSILGNQARLEGNRRGAMNKMSKVNLHSTHPFGTNMEAGGLYWWTHIDPKADGLAKQDTLAHLAKPWNLGTRRT